MIEAAVACAAIAAIAALFFLHPVGTSDLFWQMKAGEIIWGTHEIPCLDIFSYSAAGNPWTNHEWLAGLLFFGAWRLGGFVLLSFLSFIVGLCIVAAVYAGARTLSGSRAAAAVLAFCVCAAGAQRFQQFRPDLFAFLFFAVLLWLVFSCGDRGRRRLWFLIPMHILWANLHASAIIGPPLLLFAGAASIFAARRRGEDPPIPWPFLAALVALCAGALLLNPFGAGAYSFPLEHIGQGFSLSVTSDWARATWFRPQADVAAWGLAALACACIAEFALRRGRTPFPWAAAAVAAACLPAALRMMRFVPFAAIALAFFLAALLRRPAAAGATAPRPRWVAAIAIAVAFGSIVLLSISGPLHGARPRPGGVDLVLGPQVGIGFGSEDFPVEAVDFLDRAGIGGHIFNDMSWGGYLIWRRWPAHEVLIDTRTPVYGDALVKAYSDALFDAGAFEKLAARFDITHVLYDVRDISAEGGALRFLFSDPRWRLVFRSPNAAVLLRSDLMRAEK